MSNEQQLLESLFSQHFEGLHMDDDKLSWFQHKPHHVSYVDRDLQIFIEVESCMSFYDGAHDWRTFWKVQHKGIVLEKGSL